MKPIERKAIANVPASGPGPNTATNSSAQTSEFTDREVTKTNFANRFSGRLGVTLRAASSPDRHRENDGDDGAERGDVQRLDQAVQCRPDIARIRRPHALEQIAHLLRRVVEEFRDDLDRSQRHDQCRDGAEIEGETRQTLAQA